MTRTDDDSWDITESVGATALGVAYARASESTGSCPLFRDPFAQLFVDAATAKGWRPPTGAMAERIKHVSPYAASRTKWFDDFFTTAGANGIEQAVILAAGLDARAWRLPWNSGSTVFEIDQPQVLAFKAETLEAHDAQPAARYVAVPVDLRHDWPKALREAGFDADAPTAWSAEGLLPYLPNTAQDELFERVDELSAPDSRFAVEAFGPDFFFPEYLEQRREQIRRMKVEAGEADDDTPDVADLWYIEDRTDAADWLSGHGWEVSSIPARDLMDRYGRDSGDAAMRTAFVEGRRLPRV
ncbi:SAM-dependent methyltransferase [Mycobacterium sp. AZCC_0083]|uniref:SAM-dependent methyltransferase n=1 Tax=Mycobacterium sp. AZCC_0083 TaxID=2735882 RepID=UPI00160723F4|nr:class I SAM-dependent methyltransferase [Mycobacterium sp. AZCC_0083]MBB5161866.1 methyltransferase (TIGR00027 family) [Mycobacterium sp. AZCC_0083]